ERAAGGRAGGRRVVRHRAGVEVRLGDGVAGEAGRRGAGRERRDVADRRGVDVVVADADPRDRHVARVGDRVAVDDGGRRRAVRVTAGDRLVQRQRRTLRGGRRRTVGRVRERAAGGRAGGRRVVRHRAGVEVRLGDGVAGEAGRRGAGRERRDVADRRGVDVVVADADPRDRHVARVGDRVAVDDGGRRRAVRVTAGDRLVQRQRRTLRGGRRRTVGRVRERAAGGRAGGRRVVRHRAGVEVRLGDGVAGEAGRRGAGRERRDVADRRGVDVVVADADPRDRHVARVGDRVAVDDGGRRRAVRVTAGDRLVQRQRRTLRGGRRRTVGRVRERAAGGRAGGRRVVRHRAGVEVRLGDGVAGEAGRRGAGRERRDVADRRGVDVVVADADPRDRHVARVGDRVAVDDGGRRRAVRVTAGDRLVQRQRRTLRGGRRRTVGRVRERAAGGRARGRRVVRHRAGVEVRLGDGVAGEAGRRGAGGQRRDVADGRGVDVVVADADPRDRHVARVGDRVAVDDGGRRRAVRVTAGDRLVQRQRRTLRGGRRRTVGRVRERAAGGRAGGRRVVRHRAGVEVGLGDGVAGEAGDRGAGRE